MKNVLYILVLLLITVSSCKKPMATVVYQDDLTTDNQTWLSDSTVYSVIKFDQGHYSIRVDSPNRITHTSAPYANINFPHTVQVDGTTVLDNTNQQGAIGILFDQIDSIDYTVAEIWTNGTYRIWQKVNGLNSILVDFTYNTAIQTGSGSKNTIKVIQNKSDVEMVVNNISMGIFTIPLPAQLVKTGPSVSTASALNFTPVTGLFNNFSISKN